MKRGSAFHARIWLMVAITWESLAAFVWAPRTPGHDVWQDYVSMAAATGQPDAQMIRIIGTVGTVAHLGFAAYLVAAWRQHRVAWLIVGFFTAFLVLFGVSLQFQCDPGCALETREAMTHHVVGVAAFVCLGLCAVAYVALTWMGRIPKHRMRLALAVALIVWDLAFLASDLTDIYRGLVERVMLLLVFGWSIALGATIGKPTALAKPSSPSRLGQTG